MLWSKKPVNKALLQSFHTHETPLFRMAGFEDGHLHMLVSRGNCGVCFHFDKHIIRSELTGHPYVRHALTILSRPVTIINKSINRTINKNVLGKFAGLDKLTCACVLVFLLSFYQRGWMRRWVTTSLFLNTGVHWCYSGFSEFIAEWASVEHAIFGGRRGRSRVHTERAEASILRRNEERNAKMNDGTKATVPKLNATVPVWECVGFKQSEQGVSSWTPTSWYVVFVWK